ncbi:MAG: hypothetical protein KY455_09255 [Euryarchaeota archaeon]|nr:hypothetical protein [Euryarchaeota archaeon]
MAYTIEDTPGTIRRIEKDLTLIEDSVRQADPALRSLVLTGGFARGEGAVLDGAPQNDYDLVAIRSPGRTRTSYDTLRKGLEKELGLHLDLAPVLHWRLPWVSSSIFWYETALRGRVLWGDDLLDRIPVRDPTRLDKTEGLRLLTNRAAGLLLVARSDDAHARRIQAAKGLLAALDAHLFAKGVFPPSQTERYHAFLDMLERCDAPASLIARHDAITWAYRFKTDPGGTPSADAHQVWREAAAAILEAVPVGLKHAGMGSLDDLARQDNTIDRLYFALNSGRVPHVRRAIVHPTGRVRTATLRILHSARDGTIRNKEARRYLAGLVHDVDDPLVTLEALREATLQ